MKSSSQADSKSKEHKHRKTLKAKSHGGKENHKTTTTKPRSKLTMEENLANELTAMLSINFSTSSRRTKSSSWERRKKNELKNRESIQRCIPSLVNLIKYTERFLNNHEFFAGKSSDTSCATIPHLEGNINIWPPLDVWSKSHLDGWKSHKDIADKFRIDRIDLSHITEFSTFTFYMDFDYNDLLEFTEEMISGLIRQELRQKKRRYHANGINKDAVEINFGPPFRTVSLIEGLEESANLNIPKDFSSDVTNRYLIDACTKYHIKCLPPLTTARLLDNLVKHFLVEKFVNPTFIIDYPEIMNPLAKSHRSKPGLTESFKLFINKNEFCNGYASLNDPALYRERLFAQLKGCQSGDAELMALDGTSDKPSECRLPVTGFWGLAIDRLLMLVISWEKFKEIDSAQRDKLSSKDSQSHNMEC